MLDYVLQTIVDMHIYYDNGLPIDLKCTQLTLGISMFKNIFLLHIKMSSHDTFQVVYSVIYSSFKLKCKIIISSVQYATLNVIM